MNLTATHERKDGLTEVIKWFSNEPIIQTSEPEQSFDIEKHVTVKMI